jgi:hypothetical protein
MQMRCVLYETETESSYIIQFNFRLQSSNE